MKYFQSNRQSTNKISTQPTRSNAWNSYRIQTHVILRCQTYAKRILIDDIMELLSNTLHRRY